MKKTFLYRTVYEIIVCAHSDEPPTTEEWAGMVAHMAAMRQPKVDILVSTDSVGPDARQRATLKALPFSDRVRPSVITRSVAVRGMATALAWLGVPIRAFAPDELEAAGDYLGLRGAPRETAFETLAELRLELAGGSTTGEAARTLGVPPSQLVRTVLQTPFGQLRRRVQESSGPRVAARRN